MRLHESFLYGTVSGGPTYLTSEENSCWAFALFPSAQSHERSPGHPFPLKSMPIFSTMYAYLRNGQFEVVMRTATKMKRASFFVDEATLRRAQKVLGVKSRAEVVRLSVERVIEMEEFWQFMEKSRGTVKPGSFEAS